MAKGTRRYGNRTFYYYRDGIGADAKKSLQKIANSLRKRGFRARVIDEGFLGGTRTKHYVLWTNPSAL